MVDKSEQDRKTSRGNDRMNDCAKEQSNSTFEEQKKQPTGELPEDEAVKAKRNLAAILTETAYLWLLLVALVILTIYLAWGR
jgi:hypothetical protein